MITTPLTPPPWVDPVRFPFASRGFQTDAGRMHFVDEGQGPPIVMLHGNPTWSFLYRHLIGALAPNYRCIAPDYIGFGLSDKPADWSYRPPEHAAHVEALITQLGLEDITLVVHDWGGPIGLAYATRHPENVRRLIVTNTWMGPLDGDPWITLFSRLLGGSVGRVLIERFNAFARVVLPLAFADRRRLDPMAFRHYLKPLAYGSRTGSWVFPRALLGETDWLRALAARREQLAGIPALIAWGLRDPAFRPPYLRPWQALFPDATVHRLPVGHYVAEEAGPDLVPLVRDFLKATA